MRIQSMPNLPEPKEVIAAAYKAAEKHGHHLTKFARTQPYQWRATCKDCDAWLQVEPDLKNKMHFGGDVSKQCKRLPRITLDEAIALAEERVKYFGHTLGPWKRERFTQGDPARMTASCKCGLWVQASSKPLVEGTYVWGSAIGTKHAEQLWDNELYEREHPHHS